MGFDSIQLYIPQISTDFWEYCFYAQISSPSWFYISSLSSQTKAKSLLLSRTVHLCDRYSFNSMTLVLVTTGSVRICAHQTEKSRDAEVCKFAHDVRCGNVVHRFKTTFISCFLKLNLSSTIKNVQFIHVFWLHKIQFFRCSYNHIFLQGGWIHMVDGLHDGYQCLILVKLLFSSFNKLQPTPKFSDLFVVIRSRVGTVEEKTQKRSFSTSKKQPLI